MAFKIKLIMPTPLNVLNLVNETIVTNFLRGRTATMNLPSLYKLAFAVVNNTGAMTVAIEDVEPGEV